MVIFYKFCTVFRSVAIYRVGFKQASQAPQRDKSLHYEILCRTWHERESIVAGSRWKSSRLWTHPGFMKLWTAQTISLLGSAITTLALPLTAITLLHANPLQMGILFALGQISPLMVGL